MHCRTVWEICSLRLVTDWQPRQVRHSILRPSGTITSKTLIRPLWLAHHVNEYLKYRPLFSHLSVIVRRSHSRVKCEEHCSCKIWVIPLSNGGFFISGMRLTLQPHGNIGFGNIYRRTQWYPKHWYSLRCLSEWCSILLHWFHISEHPRWYPSHGTQGDDAAERRRGCC